MQIISGKAIAEEIKASLKHNNSTAGLSPCLAVIDIGDNKENALYINLKKVAVDDIGGSFRGIKLNGNVHRNEVLQIIQDLNQDQTVDGILMQLPLPANLEADREILLEAIAPHKDVDGFCPRNRGLLMGAEPDFISCAALACLDISRRYMSPLAGKKVLLVGNSFDVIQPLALLFIREASDVAIVPQYHPQVMKDIDIAIIEQGAPLQVGPSGIKAGALLIDAGFHWHQERVCGNIDRDAFATIDGYLLPVPGGMGPLLIAQLMENLTKASKKG
jgi:methylenetetrahydrofolate dehydrogenase (NADP+) / methenyltetrahydrofolate cyclohydrolase